MKNPKEGSEHQEGKYENDVFKYFLNKRIDIKLKLHVCNEAILRSIS